MPVFPGGAAFWQMDTFSDFARGTFTGISLARDGRLSLAPRLEEVFATGQALVWAMAEDAGNVYVGTGHSGKIFRLVFRPQAGGPGILKASEFFDAPEPDIFALATDRQNNLYAGSSPDGKVYKIGPDGSAREFFNPQAKYIWSLALDAEGRLYVGTGDRGRIFRVNPDGQGALFFDTHQTHVMSLAVAPDQTIVAGSDPNGLLYRISPAGKGLVLYDAPLAEIHSVALAPDGSVYAAAIAAGAPRGRGGAAFDTGVTGDGLTAPISITVQATQQLDPGGDRKDRPREAPGAAEKAAREATATAVSFPALDASAGTRSAIYRIAPDRTVETVWSSRDETVYDILAAVGRDDAALLFSTDERGRVYRLTERLTERPAGRLSGDRQTTLLVQTNEEQTTRLLRRGPHVLAATSNLGKVFRLESASSERGWYESPVKDTRSISAWGKVSWRAGGPAGARIEFFTRGGNSATPDNTWTEWEAAGRPAPSAAAAARAGLFEARIASPPARYLQWKAVFHATPPAPPDAGGAVQVPGDARSAVLEEVSVAYLSQNRAPVIHSLTANPAPYLATVGAGARSTSPTVTAAGGLDPMVVIVDDTGGVRTSAPQVVTGSSSGAGARAAGSLPTVTVAWHAEDPDADRLVYALHIRGEGEREWKLLKDGLRDLSFQPEPESLPDGKYVLRLTASDAEANPPQSARDVDMLSAPFLVDNTPPVVKLVRARRTGNSAEARFEAADAASVLRRAEYSVDGGAWVPVYSDDGIVDSHAEVFVLSLANLAPGEHVVVLRVYDSGGNVGLGKAVMS